MGRHGHRVVLPRTACVVALVTLIATTPAAARGFSAHVTNPWFPLKPGTTFVSIGAKDGRAARDVFAVTHRTRRIDGARCIAVHDRLYLGGRLAERTTDYYTQDAHGTVWYFGDDTAELDARGNVTSTEGSWRAGRDGGRAGIFMPAHPRVGERHRQELLRGHAEDHFQVVSLTAPVAVPYGTFSNALRTREWTPLEPGVIDAKYYVRGIGQVSERSLRGGNERASLVRILPARE
ncbi:MAG TPA: hypothetical protein VFG31_08105 [Conexibacter sp.]|nr:hypothetical protein [Conexibacter sp.]